MHHQDRTLAPLSGSLVEGREADQPLRRYMGSARLVGFAPAESHGDLAGD